MFYGNLAQFGKKSNLVIRSRSATVKNYLADMIDLNYTDKINSIRKMISSWSKRNISTIGRITVIKTLLLPKLIHLFMSLPTPEDYIIREINTLFLIIFGILRLTELLENV